MCLSYFFISVIQLINHCHVLGVLTVAVCLHLCVLLFYSYFSFLFCVCVCFFFPQEWLFGSWWRSEESHMMESLHVRFLTCWRKENVSLSLPSAPSTSTWSWWNVRTLLTAPPQTSSDPSRKLLLTRLTLQKLVEEKIARTYKEIRFDCTFSYSFIVDK